MANESPCFFSTRAALEEWANENVLPYVTLDKYERSTFLMVLARLALPGIDQISYAIVGSALASAGLDLQFPNPPRIADLPACSVNEDRLGEPMAVCLAVQTLISEPIKAGRAGSIIACGRVSDWTYEIVVASPDKLRDILTRRRSGASSHWDHVCEELTTLGAAVLTEREVDVDDIVTIPRNYDALKQAGFLVYDY